MSDGFIVSTSSEGLQMLGSAAQRSFELISGTVRAQLGDDVAGIFAEPIPVARGAATEWYTSATGRLVPFQDLTVEDQTALRQTLARHLEAIAALAQRISARNLTEDFWLAEALRNAVEVPDDTALWALRPPEGALRPILVNWARLNEQRRAVRGVLTTLSPRKEAAAAAPVLAPAPMAANPAPVAALTPVSATTAAATPWALWPLLILGWLILAGLIAVLTWLMVAPCGLQPAGLFSNCASAAQAGVTIPDQRRELLAEIAALDRRLNSQDQSCSLQGTLPQDPARKAEMTLVPAAPDAGTEAELDRRLTAKGLTPGADLQISLLWDTSADLDLLLKCPSGETADFRKLPLARCAAVLDVDANFPLKAVVADPVENISVQAPQAGHYIVTVRKARDQKPGGDTPFQVFIRQKDGAQQAFDGSLRPGTDLWTHDLEISAP